MNYRALPPGWYADPEQRGQFRWWDGERWTEHRAPMVQPRPMVRVPPPRPRRRLWIVLAVVVPIMGIAGAALAFGWDPVTPEKPVSILYLVNGTAKTADLTYVNSSGNVAQQNGVDVPVVRKAGGAGIELTARHGQYVSISAQNRGTSGTITCTIAADGKAFVANSSSGGYAIVDCSGRVP